MIHTSFDLRMPSEHWLAMEGLRLTISLNSMNPHAPQHHISAHNIRDTDLVATVGGFFLHRLPLAPSSRSM